VNNPHTLQQLYDNFPGQTTSISKEGPCHAMKYFFTPQKSKIKTSVAVSVYTSNLQKFKMTNRSKYNQVP
jgi:hypothetical protein